jgi:outer membrane protein TolC
MRQSPLRPAVSGLCLLLLLLAGAGCARFDALRVRQEQTETFTADLASLAATELAGPLSLDDCLRIAMVNSYGARLADLERELRRIGKNVAFTAFLPNVAAAAGYSAYSRDPQVTDKRFGTAELDIGMPIFMPSSWFLYAAARHGYASAEIAAHYVRQGIVLETTTHYFNLVVQQDTIAALETQEAAARRTSDRVRALAAEGLVARWEGDRALQLAETRAAELNRARRQLTVLRGELLRGLGLSPLAPVEISGEVPEFRRPEGSLEALVLRALEVHPRLALADRQVVIQEHRVRQAFCGFLPTISLFASGTWTGNDLAVHAANWVSGFRGAWTLFDGLANVARYQAARVERRQSELERENTFLAIMVQVVAAEAAVHDAAEAAHIRQRIYDVAAARYADYDAKAREGLLPMADALDAQADMDLAQVALVHSRYQERIALANLELAMGLTLVPEAPTGTQEGL